MADSSTYIKRFITLASQSPRRFQLLQGLALELDLEIRVVVPSETEKPAAEALEAPLPGERASDYVQRVARLKALDGWARCTRQGLPESLLLASDTTVAVDDQILGKPADHEEARSMLRRLSGRTHQVMTAVWVASPAGANPQATSGPILRSALSISEVDFDVLDPAWIDWVVSTGEPSDKAGAYALQGHAAAVVREVRGSPSGIIGLPVRETRTLLLEALA